MTAATTIGQTVGQTLFHVTILNFKPKINLQSQSQQIDRVTSFEILSQDVNT